MKYVGETGSAYEKFLSQLHFDYPALGRLLNCDAGPTQSKKNKNIQRNRTNQRFASYGVVINIFPSFRTTEKDVVSQNLIETMLTKTFINYLPSITKRIKK